VDNDHTLLTESSGLTRRQMLFGTGALAAGYAVSQLGFGTAEAAAADRLVIPGDFPWVDLGDPRDGGAGEAAVEAFARYAGLLGYQRYRLSQAPG
jgi:hypothetical protein